MTTTRFFDWSCHAGRGRDRHQDPYSSGDGELLEMEAPHSTKDAMIIAFKIPEAPYSDETFKQIHRAIDLFDSVHSTMEIFEEPLADLLGVGVEALAPLAAFVGQFMALGSGYAEAWAKISRDRIRVGFGIGVVTGAAGAKWAFLKRNFWEDAPESYISDPVAGKKAQNAFNTGLATGFIQGQQLAKNSKRVKFFWDSIRVNLTHGDRIQFVGDPKTWSDGFWRDYYFRMAGIFNELYLRN